MPASEISPPERLSPEHDLTDFDCGEASLDNWLRRRASNNEAQGVSRTYVVRIGERVVGYYSLAVGSLAHIDAPSKVKRNTPDPIPVIVLARLAVDRSAQRKGIGPGLLRDAILRTLQAAEIAGIRAVLVHAISDRARRFYESFGFRPSPINPMTLTITISEAARFLAKSPPR